MRRLLPFLACLMLVLTTWVGIAHAAEARGVETSVVDRGAHMAGDGDEVPADADKAYPHHHATCHEHHADTPAVSDVEPSVVAAADRLPLTYARALDRHHREADLRPPNA